MDTPAEQPHRAENVARVVIDRELCIGAASCIAVAPEAFELDGENIAVTKPLWSTLTDEQLLNAAKACPVAAILLYGRDGKKIYPDQ